MQLELNQNLFEAKLAILGIAADPGEIVSSAARRGTLLSESTIRRIAQQLQGSSASVQQLLETLEIAPSTVLAESSRAALDATTATLNMSPQDDPLEDDSLANSVAVPVSPTQYARAFESYPVCALCLTEETYVNPRISGAPIYLEYASEEEKRAVLPHVVYAFVPGIKKTPQVISAAEQLQRGVLQHLSELSATSLGKQRHGLDLVKLLEGQSGSQGQIVEALEILKKCQCAVLQGDLRGEVSVFGSVNSPEPFLKEPEIIPNQILRGSPEVEWKDEEISVTGRIGVVDFLTVLAPSYVQRVEIRYSPTRKVGPIGNPDCLFNRLGDPVMRRLL